MKKIFTGLLALSICVGIVAQPLMALSDDTSTKEDKVEETNKQEVKEEVEAKDEVVLKDSVIKDELTLEQNELVEEIQLEEVSLLDNSIVTNETELVNAIHQATDGSEIVIQGGLQIQLTSSLSINTAKLNQISFVSSDSNEVVLLNAAGNKHIEIIGNGDSNIIFKNVVLSGEATSNKGGINYSGSANHKIDGLVARNNTIKSGWYDGFLKIEMSGGSFTLENARFDENKINGRSDGNGLAIIYIDTSSSVTTLNNVVLNSNVTMNQGGSPVSAFLSSAQLNLNNVTMTNGTSAGNSAGVYVQEKGSSSFNVNESNFESNTLTSHMGGAMKINLQGTSVASVEESNFTGNYGDRGAGAIDIVLESANTVNLINNTFTNNKGSMLSYDPNTGVEEGLPSTGGAVSVSQQNSEGSITIEGSMFKGNEATDGGGFYITNDNSGKTNVLINHSIFDSNIADYKGGAIKFNYAIKQDLDHIYQIKNTRITNNTVTGKDTGPSYNEGGYGGGIYIDDLQTYRNLLLLDTVTFENNVSPQNLYWNSATESTDEVSVAYRRNVINSTPSASTEEFLESRVSVYNSDDVYFDYTGFVYYEFPSDVPVSNYEGDVLVRTVAGTPAIKPIEPIAPGYTFIGWFTEDGVLWNFDTDICTDSIHNTLVAKFEKIETYTLNFETNGGTAIEPITDILGNSTVSEPSQPTREGYKFVSWYKDSEFNNLWDFETDTINSDTTLYAKWEMITHTVSFDSNGGSIVEPLLKVPTNTLIAQPDTPKKLGYKFIGWFSDNGLTKMWDYNNDVVTQDTTLFAKWEIITFTVTFESNGGTPIESLIDVPMKTLISTPKVPFKDGYKFKGWYSDKSLTRVWEFDKQYVMSNVTLYAKWEQEIPVSDTYTVKFESNGGSAVESITDIEGGSLIAKPVNPTREGFVFVGWYQDAELTSAWSFEKNQVNEDVSLYAKWEQEIPVSDTYTVKFESNGGSAVESIKDIKGGSLIAKPVNPTKEGFVFVGWYQDTELTSAWSFEKNQVNADVTLYAKWDKKEEPTAPIEPDVPEETGKTDQPEKNKTESSSDKVKTAVANTNTGFAVAGLIASIAILVQVAKKKKEFE